VHDDLTIRALFLAKLGSADTRGHACLARAAHARY
jgi:hypothetical protein